MVGVAIVGSAEPPALDTRTWWFDTASGDRRALEHGAMGDVGGLSVSATNARDNALGSCARGSNA
jgi:hypothetical protein